MTSQYIYIKSFESGYQCYTRLFKSVHITLEKRDSNVQLRMYVKRTKLAYPVKMHSLHKYAAAVPICSQILAETTPAQNREIFWDVELASALCTYLLVQSRVYGSRNSIYSTWYFLWVPASTGTLNLCIAFYVCQTPYWRAKFGAIKQASMLIDT